MPLNVIRSHRVGLPLTLILSGFLGLASAARAQAPAVSVEAGLQAMRAAAAAPVNTVSSTLTGLVSFMSTQPGAPVPVAATATDSADARAAAFLAAYGRAFGIAGPAWGRVERVTGPDDLGMERVRYRQLHAGIPVTAGEMSIHLNGTGVVAVPAKTLVVKNKINPTPSFSAEEATARARRSWTSTSPAWRRAIRSPGSRCSTAACWRLGAADAPGLVHRGPAHRSASVHLDRRSDGRRLLDFSQLTDARQRRVYTANSRSTLPGTLVRSESAARHRRSDADAAYDFSGDTYNYYLAQHGRDSYDGMGGPIISTVHYCPCNDGCDYGNAFWNGVQMVYGNGFSPGR